MSESIVTIVGIALLVILLGTLAGISWSYLVIVDAIAAPKEGSTTEKIHNMLGLRIRSRFGAISGLLGAVSLLLVSRLFGPTGTSWMFVGWMICALILIALCVFSLRVLPRLPLHRDNRVADRIRLSVEAVGCVIIYIAAVVVTAR